MVAQYLRYLNIILPKFLSAILERPKKDDLFWCALKLLHTNSLTTSALDSIIRRMRFLSFGIKTWKIEEKRIFMHLKRALSLVTLFYIRYVPVKPPGIHLRQKYHTSTSRLLRQSGAPQLWKRKISLGRWSQQLSLALSKKSGQKKQNSGQRKQLPNWQCDSRLDRKQLILLGPLVSRHTQIQETKLASTLVRLQLSTHVCPRIRSCSIKPLFQWHLFDVPQNAGRTIHAGAVVLIKNSGTNRIKVSRMWTSKERRMSCGHCLWRTMLQ